jgi:hypothetical protein
MGSRLALHAHKQRDVPAASGQGPIHPARGNVEQLNPVEELLEAARREVAVHRASCALAQRRGALTPDQRAGAEATAEGIDEFLSRFAVLKTEVHKHSAIAEDELKSMRR